MNKNLFFISAIRSKAHWKRDWVLRAFSLVREKAVSPNQEKTAYRIVQEPTGFFFVNPMNNDQLEAIDDAVAGQALFTADTPLTVPAKFFNEWPEGGITTVGNLLFNATVIWPAFAGRFGYFNTYVNIGDFEQKLADLLVDDIEPGQTKDTTKVYVEDYLKFCKAMGYLQEFTQLFCWGLTEKAITPPTGLAEKKAEVLAKYEGMLNDPLTQTKIYKELIAFDADYLKGDDSERFLISEKSRAVVRRKLFLIQGAEAGLTNSQEMPLIKNSLSEGWEKEALPRMIDALRAGSFDRGSETELGGVVAKWLMRATGNIRILDEDCGTKLGKVTEVTSYNSAKLIGRYLTEESGMTLVKDAAQAAALIGRTVLVRAPHYCGHVKTDFCIYCLGTLLSANKEAVSLAATSYGSGFLAIFLAKMHGTVLRSARMDLETALS